MINTMAGLRLSNYHQLTKYVYGFLKVMCRKLAAMVDDIKYFLCDSSECIPEFTFLCGDGNCIGLSQRCDNSPDCSDYSDEMNCGGRYTSSHSSAGDFFIIL